MDGLRFCCVQTIGELYEHGPARLAREGQRLRCHYADVDGDHGWMIFTEGAWQWDDGYGVTGVTSTGGLGP